MIEKSESFLKVLGVRVEENGVVILQDIHFSQQRLQKVAVAGETGSGKSTLLQCIAGLVQPAAGEVLFENERVKGPREVLLAGHPRIGYLSQQYELPHSLRVEQVLAYANNLSHEEAVALYDLCKISHLLKRKTNQLSGGERQRIALAKLLLTSPSLLLLDEPYSNLDVVHKRILKSVIQDIGEQLAITCTLISHDPADTLSWADEIMIMKGGRLVEQGSPEQIFRQPKSEYAASLFGNYNKLPASIVDAFREQLPLKSDENTLLIRPEHLFFTEKSNTTLKGKVKRTTFYGSYYEVEVQLAKASLKVRCNAMKVAAGETVYLSFSPSNIIYLEV